MPQIRDLTAEATATAEQPQAATGIVKMDDGASLFEKAMSGTVATMTTAPNTAKVPYVGNASTRSPNWPSFSAAGLADGDFYLAAHGQFYPLKPFTFWLLTSTGFKTKMDESGNILACSTDMSERQLDEHYVGVFLVELAGSLIPARGSMRTTKANTILHAYNGVKMASDPNFGKLSDAHGIAMQAQAPWMRVVKTATTVQKISKTGSRAGKPYITVNVTTKPSTLAQIQKIYACLNDDEFKQNLQTAFQSYSDEVNRLTAAAGGQ